MSKICIEAYEGLIERVRGCRQGLLQCGVETIKDRGEETLVEFRAHICRCGPLSGCGLTDSGRKEVDAMRGAFTPFQRAVIGIALLLIGLGLLAALVLPLVAHEYLSAEDWRVIKLYVVTLAVLAGAGRSYFRRGRRAPTSLSIPRSAPSSASWRSLSQKPATGVGSPI